MKQVDRGARHRPRVLPGVGPRRRRPPALGPWRQVNVTDTRQGALRGMHAEDMVKLVAVVAGEAFAAYVDLRPASATYGKVVTTTLTPGPPGARARRASATASRPPPRAAASTSTASTRSGCRAWPGWPARPLDPALGIDWPLPIDPDDPSQMSAKDRDAPLLADLGGDPGEAARHRRRRVHRLQLRPLRPPRDRRRGRRVRRPHLRRQPVDAQGRRRRPPLLLREGRHLRSRHPRGGDGRRRRGRALRGREPRRPLDRRLRRLRQHELLRHQHRDGHRPPPRDRPGRPHRHRRGLRLGGGRVLEGGRPARAPVAVLGVEGRLRPHRAQLPPHPRAARHRHPLHQQLRARTSTPRRRSRCSPPTCSTAARSRSTATG